MDLQNYIREWVQYDNQLQGYVEKAKEIRIRKNDLTEEIFKYAEQNNIENAIIEISDGKLKFLNTKQTSSLNFKFLEKCLMECIGDPQNVKDIVNYIKQKREIKYTNDIKRTYNKVI